VEPLTDFVPLHAPLALQLVALEALHESVADFPVPTLGALVLKVSDGGSTTLTVTDLVMLPPLPLHESEKLVVAPGATFVEPLRDFCPDHAPDATQLVVFDELHDSVVDWPNRRDEELIENARVGDGTGAAIALTLTSVNRTAEVTSPEVWELIFSSTAFTDCKAESSAHRQNSNQCADRFNPTRAEADLKAESRP